MSNIVIIGCGVVGAAIAYELSLVSGLKVTVLDKQTPAQGSTGAALGVIMGVISQKVKGKAWQMRAASIQRYETLIPELRSLTKLQILFNQQGILMLCSEGENLAYWENLVEIRQSQGWNLEIWDTAQVNSRCPQLNTENAIAAVYSPQDRQVDPTTLTRALVDAAQQKGVFFQFGVTANHIQSIPETAKENIRYQIQTTAGQLEADWVVVAAGLGSTPLTASLQQPIDIRPVLGQALQVRLPNPLGHLDFQPVITGHDVHIVPLGKGDYWVGATVEFPTNTGDVIASPTRLDAVRQQAIALCPSLSQASVIKTWSGLRPRPEARPAPIIEPLPGYSHVLLATGHYRNGVLLAPATAQAIREMIVGKSA